LPAVLKNTTSSALDVVGTVHFPNDVLLLHPGADGQYAIVRFTAPTAATYSVSGIFVGLDNQNRTTTDDHIYTSTDNLYSASVNSSTYSHAFSFTKVLAADETLDFSVGYGPDSLYYDSTGLSATISPTPEPGFYWLMSLGLAGLGTVVIRRRKNSTTAA
jgi:hypothetical protein